MVNDLTRDLAQMAVDAGIGQALDEDVFYDLFPKDPDEIVAFVEYGGSATAMFTNTSVRGVSVLVRSRTENVARQKLWDIFQLVDSPNKIVQIGSVIAIISVRSTPRRVSTDSVGRALWSFSMGVTYRYK